MPRDILSTYIHNWSICCLIIGLEPVTLNWAFNILNSLLHCEIIILVNVSSVVPSVYHTVHYYSRYLFGLPIPNITLLLFFEKHTRAFVTCSSNVTLFLVLQSVQTDVNPFQIPWLTRDCYLLAWKNS